jgi:hypothetical protein
MLASEACLGNSLKARGNTMPHLAELGNARTGGGQTPLVTRSQKRGVPQFTLIRRSRGALLGKERPRTIVLADGFVVKSIAGRQLPSREVPALSRGLRPAR